MYDLALADHDPKPLHATRRRALAYALLLPAFWCCAPAPRTVTPQEAEPSSLFAITGVELIPMDDDRSVENQTVLVDGDSIAAVGADGSLEIPRDALVIDGKGQFLVPGLWDLHVHVEREESFLFFLANGVTTALNLSGRPWHFELREAAAAGRAPDGLGGTLPGPRLFTCGPILHGDRVELEDVAAEVARQATAGYDCIKIYDTWSPEAFAAVADAAQAAGLPLMGHAPRNLPLQAVLDDGRERIVHLEEIIYTTAPLQGWLDKYRRGEEPRPEDAPRVALADEVRRVARAIHDAGVWVVPTHTVIDTYRRRSTPAGLAALGRRPYYRFLDPVTRRAWARGDQSARRIRHEQHAALQQLMLEIFREEGVRLAVGTDAGLGQDLQVAPGWSIHEEMALLRAAGFTPYEVLRQATVEAAAYLGVENSGRIAPGYRADLLLVAANPLEDLANLEKLSAVVAGGRWVGARDLGARLEALARSYQPLEEELESYDELLESGEWAAAVAHLREASDPDPRLARFLESAINREGYRRLAADDFDGAIEVFRQNTLAFPSAANTWDSLAEAHLLRGDRAEAIRFYRKALAVRPDFSNAARMLRERLGVEP